jgi:predicted O-linked N-acetylglucosamine transferase (SPINDLY family)
MLFLYPHELPHAYEAGAVPQWLLQDYMPYMLAAPPMFREAGEAQAWCDYATRWTGYLHDAVLANINTEFWRRVGLLFTQTANFIPLYFNAANLRDLYRKRAVLMEATLRVLGQPLDHVPPARPKRERIRVGILASHYSPQTETYATLPVYRHLDRTKFEVILFSLAQTRHPLEQFCAQYADRFVVLPREPAQRVQALRSADLDLVFIGTNTTAVANDIVMLALHRLARVQVASVCSCVTTGMRNVDYYLSGALSEPADAQSHYTEKLVMLEGSAHCYDFSGDPPAAPGRAPTREDLGIPHDAVVFASGANFYKVLPEVEESWMRVLSAVPGSRLVLYPFNPNWSSTYPVGPFGARLTAAMARNGIDPERVVVLAPSAGRSDVLARLRLADIYLDSFPFSGATSLLDPLQTGLPPVVMDGTSFRSLVAAALLREIGIEELIARDPGAYVALAARLGGDKALRQDLQARIRSRMEAVPRFLDAKRYGAQAGAAFERMWAEYLSRRGQ